MAVWLLVMAAVGATLLRLPYQRTQAVQLVEHTHMVLLNAEELRGGLLDAIAGQRDYLLIRDPAYLPIYERGAAIARERLAALQRLTANNNSQQHRLVELDRLLAARLAELVRTLDLARSGDAFRALALVRTDEGRAMTDRIRAILVSVIDAEKQLLAERQTANEASERHTRTMLIMLSLATTALLAVLLALATQSLLRRQSKRAQTERETILQTITDGFAVLDADYRYTYVNDAAETLLGSSKEDLLGKSHWDLYPAALGTIVEKEYRRVMNESVPVTFENFYVPWQRWFEMRAYPAPSGGITVYFQDITERKRAGTELRASEERFRAAVQAVSGILWTNNAAGEMAGEQHGWAALTGQAYDEYQGYGWSKAVHPEDAQPTIDAWNEAVAARKTFLFEHRVRRHDGVWRRFAIRALPVLQADGTIREWVGVHTDVTVQRDAEAVLARDKEELEQLVEGRTAALLREVEERRRAEEALRQGEKLQAIGQLTGGIAHDFNNILQVVSSGAFLLRSPKLDDEKRAIILDGLGKAAENAKALTGRLLAFARKQPLQPESFDVNERLMAMSELLRHTLGSRIRVETDFASDLWPARADPNQLEVAILNLAVNARDAMADGGTLTLQTRTAKLEARAECVAGDYVCVAVKDTGQGMPPAVMARVFEPFFTTKGPNKGTGLGLAQVHGFAKQSGGDIAIESAPGEGTTITLHLPRATGDLLDASISQVEDMAAHPMQRAAGRTVLVVEDNADVAEFAASMLEGLGYTTRWARSAAETLKLLEAGEPIDAVFSDVMMPGEMNGLDLAGVLRKSYPHLPIVLATGYSEVLAEWDVRTVAEVLGKPYRLDDLAAALERAFAAREPETGS